MSGHDITLRNFEQKYYISFSSLSKACGWSDSLLTQKIYNYNNYTCKNVKRIEIKQDVDDQWIGYKETIKLLEYHTDGINSDGTELHVLLQKMRRYNPSKENRKRK